MDDNDDLSPKATAVATGLSEATLANYRWRGIGPPWRKIGRRITYPKAGVQEWRDRQIRTPAS